MVPVVVNVAGVIAGVAIAVLQVADVVVKVLAKMIAH